MLVKSLNCTALKTPRISAVPLPFTRSPGWGWGPPGSPLSPAYLLLHITVCLFLLCSPSQNLFILTGLTADFIMFTRIPALPDHHSPVPLQASTATWPLSLLCCVCSVVEQFHSWRPHTKDFQAVKTELTALSVFNIISSVQIQKRTMPTERREGAFLMLPTISKLLRLCDFFPDQSS